MLLKHLVCLCNNSSFPHVAMPPYAERGPMNPDWSSTVDFVRVLSSYQCDNHAQCCIFVLQIAQHGTTCIILSDSVTVNC